MPLSASFRREMLMAMKNAKKKREGDEAQNQANVEDDADDVVPYSSKILAKPLEADPAPNSGETASAEPMQNEIGATEK